MLGFPKGTEFGKRIPKQKFYENLEVPPALRLVFQKQISTVYWRNKLAADTIHVAAGEQVQEIEVFEVHLFQPQLDEVVLRQIDREIPYHILFVLTCEGKVQAWIGYKEAAGGGKNAFKVSGYYHTGWMPEEELALRLDGLNMDAVYENLVRQIAEMQGEVWSAKAGITENIRRDERRRQLEKEIAALKGRIRREQQFNRQVQMNTELKRLKKEWEELK